MATMVRSIQSLFFIFLFYAASAQPGFLRAKVIDAISRLPLEAVNISLQNSTAGAVTDVSGRFAIKINPGTPVLICSIVGYSTQIVPVNLDHTTLIEMQPAALNLHDIVLESSLQKQQFSTLAKVDLALKPVNNSQELLRLVPGLFVAQHAGGGKAEQIFLRGFDSDHGTDVDLSVDGMPINLVSHAHGQGYADSHFIIPETVSAIDYGAGPYYAEHGNFNTAGYVAFATLPKLEKNRIQIEGGRFATYRGLAMINLLNTKKEKQHAYVAAEANYTNGATINPQLFNRYNVFGKYTIAASANTRVTVTA